LPDWVVASLEVIPDDYEQIADRLRHWADSDDFDLILTTGGTGVGPRDVTPDATAAVADRLIPGMAEAMRAESLKITPYAMLSRAVAAQRGSAIIVNLPGSPKGAVETLAVVRAVLEHAIATMRGAGHER
jgi:molybdenum cofactor synthesis domain-containing protein